MTAWHKCHPIVDHATNVTSVNVMTGWHKCEHVCQNYFEFNFGKVLNGLEFETISELVKGACFQSCDNCDLPIRRQLGKWQVATFLSPLT